MNMLTNSFCIKVCLCTLRKLQILFFYLLYGSSCWVLNMVTPYHTKCKIKFCGSFVRVQSSFFSPRGTWFPSHLFDTHFVHIWIGSLVFMGKTWSFNLCMYILRTEKQGGGNLMFMPFEIVSICVWLWYSFQKHVILQLIHNYINSTC